MQIQVTFRNMEASDALKDYADAKLAKITKYIDEPIKADVILKIEKFRHFAEVTVNVNKSIIVSTAETEDMYSALDEATDKLVRQVRKHKARVRQHHTNGRDAQKNQRPIEE